MHRPSSPRWLLAVLASALALLPCGGCSTLSYDLAGVPFPVSASPAADPALQREPFEIRAKGVLWLHGLFGEDQPDVAALLQEECEGCEGVANFRVEVAASGHDWFLTHLTLTIVRLKTVKIRGEKLTRR